MFTEQQIKENIAEVNNIIGIVRLGGTELDAETIKDLYSIAKGEMNTSQAVAQVYERFKNGLL